MDAGNLNSGPRASTTSALTYRGILPGPSPAHPLSAFPYFFCRPIWPPNAVERSIRTTQLCTEALSNELLHARKIPSECSLIWLALRLRGPQLLSRGANGCLKVS